MPKVLTAGKIFFVLAVLCGLTFIAAQPARAQYFINKGLHPEIKTPYVAVPNNSDFPQGEPFAFIPPNKAQNSMSLTVWERVKQSENSRPTFYDDDLDIHSAEIARQWTRLYNLAKNRDLKTKLKYVNNFFNQWPAVGDAALYGEEDYWAAPWQFMNSGGDCEDYVIAKYYALKALSVPPQSMCIVIVDDFKAMITHVVLAVSDPNGKDFYVLDNITDTIYKNGAAEDYVPRYYINETNVWRPVE